MRGNLYFFFVQAFQYSVITISQRLVGRGDILGVFFVDAVYAFLVFSVVKKIQASHTFIHSVSYALGSATGAAVGVWASLAMGR